MSDKPPEDGESEPPGASGEGDKETFHTAPVWRRFYGLLLGPALLAAAVLAIFTIGSVLDADDADPRDLVEALNSGGAHRRWQAAFALTKYLQPSVQQRDAVLLRESDADYRERLEQVTMLVPELLAVWDGAATGDPQVRRFLALAFGYLGDRRLLPALTGVLDDADTELVHYALAAIGTTTDIAERNGADVVDSQLVDAVVAASEREEGDVRATATYILALFDSPAAMARLHGALDDEAPAVTWNAAFGLARHGDGGGEQIIAEILDRGPLYRAAGPQTSRRHDLFLNAILSAGRVVTPSLRTKLVRIARGDEDVAAQRAAQRQLEKIRSPRDDG